MKICPTGGLQPALTEAGLEGLWTPKLTPQVGYCDYECNRCGQVCPTQAIRPLSLADKKQTRIGLAFIDISRCLPFAFGTPCLVCEEHCPVPEKAIELRAHAGGGRGRGRGRSGGGDGAAELLYPHVVPDRCTGCGICENVCPFKERPAVYVTSANESRHPANQPILGSA
jgi:Pyruvate/2-oxoacid:ferredoxin oxidoreductase delta subunit